MPIKRDNKRGGLKLKNVHKKGFQPVMDMVNSPGSSLGVIATQARKGFIITLSIEPAYSEYNALKMAKSSATFTKPVTSFILKFAVVTPIDFTDLPSFNGVQKNSETKKTFAREAALQQNIWEKSIIGGRPEICPSVANFTLFDKPEATNTLTMLLQRARANADDEALAAADIFQYLLNCINSHDDYGIGVIVMPKVENSVTFYDFMQSPLTQHDINYVYAAVVAQVCRLFVDIGVLNFDLHAQNMLIYRDPKAKNSDDIRCVLIDFGMVADITTTKYQDIFYSFGDKVLTLQPRKKQFEEKLAEIPLDASFQQKVTYVASLMDFIKEETRDKNQRMIQYGDHDRYQMDWYESIPKGGDAFEIAFDLLKTSVSVDINRTRTITSKSIQDLQKQGHFVTVQEKDYQDDDDEDDEDNDISHKRKRDSSGGRKQRRTMKMKRTKRIKKTKTKTLKKRRRL